MLLLRLTQTPLSIQRLTVPHGPFTIPMKARCLHSVAFPLAHRPFYRPGMRLLPHNLRMGIPKLQCAFSSTSKEKSKLKQRTDTAKEVINKLKGTIPTRENIYTVPNILTFSRLLAAPFIGYMIVQHNYDVALGVFALAGFTDMLDGYIARRFNQKTFVGSIIDPAADKMLMTVMTVTLAMEGLLPVPLAGVILGRDVGLVVAAFYYRYISLPAPKTLVRYFDFSIPSAEVRPTLISKANTALQLLLMGCSLTTLTVGLPSQEIMTGMHWLVGATTVWSGASYIYSKDAVRILNQS